ncbi:hypothetical protein FGO68_gene6717 [Halteria grandinella]|uniref:Uncharacterized protein n=1 Tax=Halteria grandinella TaxID=5974 RepID=A0A8J8T2B3_HALGN|nr:hypothetical protein FGO68_gene6717 [Halteria grandinella]
MFLSSLGILGADIFLFVKTGANVFSWVFLGLGGALFVCSLMSFKLRRSIHLLGFYLLVIFSIFFFQLIATILLLVEKSGIIDKLWEKAGEAIQKEQEFKEALNENIKSVSVAMIVFSLILLSAFITGLLYRKSTANRTEDLKDHLIDQHRKDQQNQALEQAKAKNDAKRAEMEAKYPELAKYR